LAHTPCDAWAAATKVRLNTLRGKQAADIAHRIAASQIELAIALEKFERSDFLAQVLDVARMKMILSRTCQRIDGKVSREAATILLRGLGVGLFLLQFDGVQAPKVKSGS